MAEKDARRAAAEIAGEEGDLRLPQGMRPLVRLLLATQGQWRMAGGGMAPLHATAFDLVAIDVAARWLGMPTDAGLMKELQSVEREALIAMRTET